MASNISVEDSPVRSQSQSQSQSQPQAQADQQHFQQHQTNYSGFNSLAAAAAAVARHNLDYNNIVLQQQQQHWSQALASSQHRRAYTGVDKLLLAAMVEETASSASDSPTSASGQPASMTSTTTTTTTPATSAPSRGQSQQHQPGPMPSAASHFYLPQFMHQNQHQHQHQHQQQQHQLQMPQQVPYVPVGRGIANSYSSMMMSRDCMHIPTPRNKSELELYKLLERANLLHYFGTFLNFGGDDVQQLSDADEDEFLEIMSLIGMTKKPLHVRRLQKALIEWRENRDSRDVYEPSIGSSFRRPNSLAHTRSSSANSMMQSLTDESLSSDQHPGAQYVRMQFQ